MKELLENETYFKLYDFTTSLPKNQSYLLSYLINKEDKLKKIGDFYECTYSFIRNDLTDWTDYELRKTMLELSDAGLIEIKKGRGNVTLFRYKENELLEMRNSYIKKLENLTSRNEKIQLLDIENSNITNNIITNNKITNNKITNNEKSVFVDLVNNCFRGELTEQQLKVHDILIKYVNTDFEKYKLTEDHLVKYLGYLTGLKNLDLVYEIVSYGINNKFVNLQYINEHINDFRKKNVLTNKNNFSLNRKEEKEEKSPVQMAPQVTEEEREIASRNIQEILERAAKRAAERKAREKAEQEALEKNKEKEGEIKC